LVVWRSADGGEHWERAFVDATPRETLPLAVSADAVFVGLDRRVVRTDGVLSAPLDSTVTAIAVSPDGSVWAGTISGVFVSRDRGETFTPTSGPERAVALAATRGLVYALQLGGRVWRRGC
jgi:photosystem II stability/assembly factor-like uncharacterized protein